MRERRKPPFLPGSRGPGFRAAVGVKVVSAATVLLLALLACGRGADCQQAAKFAGVSGPGNPEEAVAAVWKGIRLVAAGRTPEARRWLFRAVLLHPDGQVAAVARAWLAHLPEYNARTEALIRNLALRANPGLSAGQAAWLARAVAYAATSYHLDPLFLAAVVHAESGWNHAARSRAGAVGLGQLMPYVASGMGLDPYHPVHNLWGAARLLRSHLNAFRNSHNPVDSALSAYNAGPAATRNARGFPPNPETAAYVRTVNRLYLLLLRSSQGR